jgi:hypothetical protein
MYAVWSFITSLGCLSNIEELNTGFSAMELSLPSWERLTKSSYFEIYGANRKRRRARRPWMSDSQQKVLHINDSSTENHLAGAYIIRIPSFFSITGEVGRHINVT